LISDLNLLNLYLSSRSACFALFTDSSHPEHRRLTLVRLLGAIWVKAASGTRFHDQC